MQEAIVDQVRAIEFEMESAGTAEVGSLIDSVVDESNGFQRIADEEDEVRKTKSRRKEKDRTSRKKKKATKKEFNPRKTES